MMLEVFKILLFDVMCLLEENLHNNNNVRGM